MDQFYVDHKPDPTHVHKTDPYKIIISKGILLMSITNAGASSGPAHVHKTDP